MNLKVCKKLRAVSLDLAAQWLTSVLPVAEQGRVSPATVREFEKTQDQYVTTQDGNVITSAYSSRWFYKKLKRAYEQGIKPDFTLSNVLELG
jgi:hypothetical protein